VTKDSNRTIASNGNYQNILASDSIHEENKDSSANADLITSPTNKKQLYIPINYQLLKIATSSDLPPLCKIMWLGCYIQSYLCYRSPKSGIDTFSFFSTCKELMKRYNCSKSSLSKAMNLLEQKNFISRSRNFFKRNEEQEAKAQEDRRDKSYYYINPSLPEKYIDELEKLPNRNGIDSKENSNHLASKLNIDSENIALNRSEVSCNDPEVSKNSQYLTKELKTKPLENRSNFCKIFSRKIKKKSINQKEIKNLATSGVEYSITRQKFANNEIARLKSFFNRPIRKPLASFYPLDEDDAWELHKSSNRDFNLNYINQLILKLARINPEHGFWNKSLFMDYMTKALAGELRQAPQVNNLDFRFKEAVIRNESGTIIKDEYEEIVRKEKYLQKIEEAVETDLRSGKEVSKQERLRRKIACVFGTNRAYELLNTICFLEKDNKGSDGTSSKILFKTNGNFPIKLKKEINLTEYEQKLLLAQVRAIYGEFVERLEYISWSERNNGNLSQKQNRNIARPIIPIKPLAHTSSKRLTSIELNQWLNNPEKDSIWKKISKGIIKRFDETIYRSWFSRVEVEEDHEKRLLALKAPTGFIMDWIKQNYLMEIVRLVKEEGWNEVEVVKV
jgi:hypothetical protein